MPQNTPSSRNIKKWKEEVEREKTEIGIENKNNKFLVVDKMLSFGKMTNLRYLAVCSL